MSSDDDARFLEHLDEVMTPNPDRLVDDWTPVGFLVPEEIAPVPGSTFLNQGGNIVTIPREIEVRNDDGKNLGHIDTMVLFRTLFTQNLWPLNDLVRAYLVAHRSEQRSIVEPPEYTPELRNALTGILLKSQGAMPLSSLSSFVTGWSSRNLIPKTADVRVLSGNLMAQRLMMSVNANPSGSLFDHYNSLLEEGMTMDETQEIKDQVGEAIKVIVKSGAASVSVPPSMYNQ